MASSFVDTGGARIPDSESSDELVPSTMPCSRSDAALLISAVMPVFANAIPGLPFGLDGMIGPAFGGSQRAIDSERFLELPPATPVGEGNGHQRALNRYPIAALEQGTEPESDAQGVVEGTLMANRAGTTVAFTGDRLARSLRLLEEARFGGMVTHLFALRALLPDAVGDSHTGSLPALRDLLREEFDRLFIKLRLPSYIIAPRDLETPSVRTTVERVLEDAANARGIPAESPAASLLLRGSFDPSELRDFADRLEEAELASALPWAALARLLPDGTQQLQHYRALLTDRLDALSQGDTTEFIDALQRKRDAALDGALDVVRTSLHAGV